MLKNFWRKAVVTLITACLVFPIVATFVASIVMAAPEAQVTGTNPWGSGGQITLTLSGCDGYGTITVVADFGGKVKSASGWGFDSYDVSGSQVTAKVSSSGPNSWGFNGDVGIQVEGTDIDNISLVSISGDGTSGTVSAGGNNGNGSGQGNSNGQGGQNGQGNGGDKITPDTSAAPANKGAKGDDWLTTNGSKIVDKNGTEVWLTGVNWFGYNTGTNIFDGCWSVSMTGALKSIADHGFNLLRIPMSSELILNWKNGVYPQANFNQSTNSELIGLNSLEIFDLVVSTCENYGIKIMIDIHSAETDASGHNKPLWYTDKISAEQYLESLDWISARYKDNDTIVAYDLKNEPHGAGNEQQRAIWNDSKDDNNWAYMAAKAGNTILDNNPNALIVIEGNQIFPKDVKSNNFTSMNEDDYFNAWWGGNLMGVKYYPVDMGSAARNKQIVYSPHDYGPAVYQQPWFHSGFTKDSVMDEYWYDYWFYIVDQNIAPILIGEWGGFMQGDNLTWMTYLRELIGENHLNYTFWCFNANSGDTGGLVLDDFTTWDNDKYGFVKEVIWTDSNGNFVGLDHQIPLGANGVSLSDYSGKTVAGDTSTPAATTDTTSTPTPTVAPAPDSTGTTDATEAADKVDATETEVTDATEVGEVDEGADATESEVAEGEVSESDEAVDADATDVTAESKTPSLISELENGDSSDDSSTGTKAPSAKKADQSILKVMQTLKVIGIVAGVIVGLLFLGFFGRFFYLVGKGKTGKEALASIFKFF